MDDKLISPIENLLPGALSKWILVSSIALSTFLLIVPSYDLPAKYITDTEIIKLLLRLLSAGMPLLIGAITLLVLLVLHNRNIHTELSSATSGRNSLFHQKLRMTTDRNNLQALLDESRQELKNLQKDHDALRKSSAEFERLSIDRKFMLEVAEKKIAELSKPIEAASASSAPGSDDYHATRRSFFHSDNDRPKRR